MDTLARSVSPAHLRQQDSGFTAWAKRSMVAARGRSGTNERMFAENGRVGPGSQGDDPPHERPRARFWMAMDAKAADIRDHPGRGESR